MAEDTPKEPTVTQLIHDLRIRTGEAHDRLTRLELLGQDEHAISALWAIYYLFDSTEYSKLEKYIKDKKESTRLP